jgi:hypothetical protein
MAETSHEIRRQIDDTRARLGSTIAAIERKVDPHRIVDEHPLTLVGVAFGAGVLLSTTGATGRAVHKVRDHVKQGATKINGTAGSALDGVIDAIMGAATAAITAKLSDLLNASVGGPEKNRNQVEARRTIQGRAA